MLISALAMWLAFTVQGTGVDLPGSVDLWVNDGAIQQPVANARILIYSTENVLETRSNRAGTFELKNVPPGKYRITATAADFKTYSPKNTIDIEASPSPPPPLLIRFTAIDVGNTSGGSPEISYGPIRPSQLGHLVVAVRNWVDKRSIPRTNVSVLDQTNPSSRLVAITNRAGKASFASLNPGSYVVTINLKGFHSEQATIWIPRSNLAQLTVLLLSKKQMVVCQ